MKRVLLGVKILLGGFRRMADFGGVERVRVRAPATTANLGPGFDTLGNLFYTSFPYFLNAC